ncbi:MAG: YcjF family protein [Saccharospirillum sp.]
MPRLTLPNWRRIVQSVLNPAPDPDLFEHLQSDRQPAPPVFWLLGKVQSGKTSIIHAITRHPEAEIGQGFKACTRHARQFDFPPEWPLVRFIDTRGLGEVGYHPEDELVELEQQADALIVVMRAMDPQQEDVLAHARGIRKKHPDWPVLLVQTRLHDAYKDDRDHPPYDALLTDPTLVDLQRALQYQAEQFADLPGNGPVDSLAVDLTRPEEGFSDPDYGLDALLTALDRVLEGSHHQSLRDLARAQGSRRLQQAHPHLMGYAMAAGVTDMIPMAGLVTVPTLQGKMLHSIGRLYQRDWSRRTLKAFGASLGSGVLLGMGASFGARQLGKLVPVYGQTVGALAAGTASAAVTYALGRAACYYLEQMEAGQPDPQGVSDTYHRSLKEAYQMFRQRLEQTDTSQ